MPNKVSKRSPFIQKSIQEQTPSLDVSLKILEVNVGGKKMEK